MGERAVSRAVVLIASPLERAHVERIRDAEPERVELLHEPDLLPRVRYVADHKGAPFQRDAAQQRRWEACLARADILWDLPSPADLPHLTRLRWVQTTSTGVGQAAERLGLHARGVLVTTARGVHAGPLAEFVFMALLAHFRGLRFLEAEQRAHRWVRHCGEGVAGRSIALIGAGDLARGCATLARALGMRVIAVARHPERTRTHAALFDAVLPPAQMHDALRAADAVVVTVPHTLETEALINGAAFAAMRPGAAFVNISRGQVVDEDALIASLRARHLGFAALDVTRIEPLPPESPLWAMPNVLISPHSASTVTGENAAITEIFVENLHCWLDGRIDAMRNVLDPALMY